MSHESARGGSTGTPTTRSRRLVDVLANTCKRLVNEPGQGGPVEKATKRSRELPEDRGRAGLGNKDKPSLLTVQLSPSTIASVDRQQGVTMSTVPTGTVSFLFTDIEGSTRLWQQHPEAMQQALARHDALLAAGVQQYGGRVVK